MTKEIPRHLHIILWLLFIGLLFGAFGQRIRAYETPEGLSYDLSYDFLMLLILSLDVGLKALMFYRVQRILENNSKSKYPAIILTAIASSAIAFGFWWAYQQFLQITENLGEMIFDYMLPFSLLFHLLILFFSLVYFYYRQRLFMQEEQRRLTKAQTESELALLKSQISPHFLFNTLNNIYAMTRKFEDKTAANSIASLARLMRYMTYEANVSEVSLEKELNYIEDFISLQKKRLPNSEKVRFEHQLGTGKQKQIAPMLLIPFIENAFKHGETSEEIEIRLSLDNGQLSLLVQNKIGMITDLAKEESGVGLKNVKRRLQLLYPDKHRLEIQVSEHYRVELSLNLGDE